MNLFGLGIRLDYRDNATQGLMNTSAAFDGMMGLAAETADVVTSSITSIETSIAALGAIQIGTQLENIGSSIAGVFKSATGSIIEAGSNLEKANITLGALYGSAEAGREKFAWIVDYAVKTPFLIRDLQQAVVGFKAFGMEVSTMVTSVSGQTQEFLGYVSDLAALHPERSLEEISTAIKQVSTGQTRLFRNIFGVTPEQLLGRDIRSAVTDVQGFMEDIAEMTYNLQAEGLTSALFGTWDQMVGNFQDVLDQLMTSIAEAGAFDAMKNTLAKFFTVIVDEFSTEEIAQIGKAVGDAFSGLWKPVDMLGDTILKLVKGLKTLLLEHPGIVKFVATVGALVGVVTLGAGAFLKFAGSMALAINSIVTLMPTLKTLPVLFKSLGSSILPVAVGIGLLFTAWKYNFFGIRDAADNLTDSFSRASAVFNQAIEDGDRASLKALQNQTGLWNNLVKVITDVRLVAKGFFDFFSQGWLDENTFLAINEAGLLPILNTLIKIKWGVEDTFSFFDNVLKNVGKVTRSFLKLLSFKTVPDFIKSLGNIPKFLNMAIIEGLNWFAKEGIPSIQENFSNFMDWIIKKVPVQFKVFATSIKDKVGGAFDWLGTKAIPNLVSAFTWVGDNVLPGVSRAFEWLGDNVLPGLEWAFGKVGEGLSWFTGIAGTVITEGFKWLVDTGVPNLVSALTSAGEWSKSTINMVLKSLGDFLGVEVGTGFDFFTGAGFEKLGEFLEKIGTISVDSVKAILTAVGGFFGIEFFNADLESARFEGFEKLGSFLSSIAGLAVDAVSGILSTVTSFFTMEGINLTLGYGSWDGLKSIGDFLFSIAGLADDVIGSVIGSLSSFLGINVSENLESAEWKGLSQLGSFLSQISGLASATIANVVTSIVNLFGANLEFPDSINLEWLIQLGEFLKSSADWAWVNIQNGLAALKDFLFGEDLAAVSGKLSELFTWPEEIRDPLAPIEGLYENVEKMETSTGAINTLLEALISAKDKFAPAVEAVWGKITGFFTSIGTAISQIAAGENWSDVLKDVFGIEVPVIAEDVIDAWIDIVETLLPKILSIGAGVTKGAVEGFVLFFGALATALTPLADALAHLITAASDVGILDDIVKNVVLLVLAVKLTRDFMDLATKFSSGVDVLYKTIIKLQSGGLDTMKFQIWYVVASIKEFLIAAAPFIIVAGMVALAAWHIYNNWESVSFELQRVFDRIATSVAWLRSKVTLDLEGEEKQEARLRWLDSLDAVYEGLIAKKVDINTAAKYVKDLREQTEDLADTFGTEWAFEPQIIMDKAGIFVSTPEGKILPWDELDFEEIFEWAKFKSGVEEWAALPTDKLTIEKEIAPEIQYDVVTTYLKNMEPAISAQEKIQQVLDAESTRLRQLGMPVLDIDLDFLTINTVTDLVKKGQLTKTELEELIASNPSLDIPLMQDILENAFEEQKPEIEGMINETSGNMWSWFWDTFGVASAQAAELESAPIDIDLTAANMRMKLTGIDKVKELIGLLAYDLTKEPIPIEISDLLFDLSGGKLNIQTSGLSLPEVINLQEASGFKTPIILSAGEDGVKFVLQEDAIDAIYSEISKSLSGQVTEDIAPVIPIKAQVVRLDTDFTQGNTDTLMSDYNKAIEDMDLASVSPSIDTSSIDKEYASLVAKTDETMKTMGASFSETSGTLMNEAGAVITTGSETMLDDLSTFADESMSTLLTSTEEGFSGLLTTTDTNVSAFNSSLGGALAYVRGSFASGWTNAWRGVANTVQSAFSSIENSITASLARISNMLENMTTKINQFNLATSNTGITGLRAYADGTNDYPGGLGIKDEGGKGEIVELPQHSKIYPHDKSIDVAFQDGVESAINDLKSSGGDSYEDNSENDYSVTFEAGAIQVVVANASDSEAVKFAEKVMKIIARRQEKKKIKNYKPVRVGAFDAN